MAPLVVEELLRLLGKHGNGSAQPIVQSCFLALSRLLRVPADTKATKAAKKAAKAAGAVDDGGDDADAEAGEDEEGASNADLLAAVPSSVWGQAHKRAAKANLGEVKMKTVLRSRQLRVVIRYIRASLDIQETGKAGAKRLTKAGAALRSQQSRATFALLKSIVRSRLLVSEFYDLMGRCVYCSFPFLSSVVSRRLVFSYLLVCSTAPPPLLPPCTARVFS